MKETGDWQEWSGWLKEGYFISYTRNNIRYYEYIIARDLAHYVYEWHETVSAESTSGPLVPADLVMTRGYHADIFQNRVWQMIFGIKGQVYIYVELPTDIHRHGLPKVPKPRPGFREVSHFEEWMSDFHEPTFVTEHIMMKPGYDRINFSAFNPCSISIKPYLNVFIARMVTERIGKEQAGVLTPTSARWDETLEKLHRRLIPHRPITLRPVRAPAAEE